MESKTEMGYTQPLVIERGSAPIDSLASTRAHLTQPHDGTLYWEEPFDGRANMTVADAVKSGSYFLYLVFIAVP
ncbi:MAG: hypothetical protein Ct9H300mP25_17780 [Acidobacteriota bacterium]|nr:MAG: hypothetical protein Ct9H300mP25_17780 [Acidobacteriota bacterium]